MILLLLGPQWNPHHPAASSSTSSWLPSLHVFISVFITPPCPFQTPSPCGSSKSVDNRMGLMKVFGWLGQESEKHQTAYRRVFDEGLPSLSPASNPIMIAQSVYNSLNFNIHTREYSFSYMCTPGCISPLNLKMIWINIQTHHRLQQLTRHSAWTS